jgi:hypothetical protein
MLQRIGTPADVVGNQRGILGSELHDPGGYIRGQPGSYDRGDELDGGRNSSAFRMGVRHNRILLRCDHSCCCIVGSGWSHELLGTLVRALVAQFVHKTSGLATCGCNNTAGKSHNSRDPRVKRTIHLNHLAGLLRIIAIDLQLSI